MIDTAGPVVGLAAFAPAEADAAPTPLFLATRRVVAGADRFISEALGQALERMGDQPLRLGVVVGPGAFTGLRVGLAHALGLAVARELRVVAVSSLALRAAAAPGHASVLAVLDAKKGRVYAQRFDTRGRVPVALDEPLDVSPGLLAPPPGTVATGEGAVVYRAVLEAAGATLLPGADESPVGAAWPLVRAGSPVDAAAVIPVYLREPDAQPLASLVQS